MPLDWAPDWRGQTAVIIAAGPSATAAELEALTDRHRVLAINESHRLCPRADALYGCDKEWWRRADGAPGFAGLRITAAAWAARRFGLHLVEVREDHRILTDRPGVIGSGGNGGFQALNLAIQFGAARIILVGFDMSLARGVHWHGKHAGGLNNPTPENIARWARRLDAAAPAIAALGVDVINGAPLSALTAYPKMSLKDALAA